MNLLKPVFVFYRANIPVMNDENEVIEGSEKLYDGKGGETKGWRRWSDESGDEQTPADFILTLPFKMLY